MSVRPVRERPVLPRLAGLTGRDRARLQLWAASMTSQLTTTIQEQGYTINLLLREIEALEQRITDLENP
jgi:hypothetical protein